MSGVGIRTVAELNGLKFIKIADEEYDFVIPKRLMENDEIKKFLEALRSQRLQGKVAFGAQGIRKDRRSSASY